MSELKSQMENLMRPKKITDFCKGTNLATGQIVHFSPVIVELGAL
jgi:hypothetical protein